MPRCEAILETTNQVCNSNSKLNKVRVEDPNGRYSKTLFVCQKCSDRIYGPMDALLQHWMNKRDVDWEIKKAEITKTRWKNCRHCLHPDMEVITYDGMKKISDIIIGDMVLTHKGRFQKVLEVIPTNYDGQMIKVFTKGANQEFPIITTPDHMIMTKESYYNGKGIVQKRLLTKMASHLSIQTNHQRKKDYVVFPRISIIDDISSESIDMMKIYGYYLSEGSLVRRKKYGLSEIMFSFGKSDKEYQFVSELVLALKHCGINSTVRLTIYGWRVRVYNVKLAELLKSTFNEHADKKMIQTWIKLLPPEKLHVLFDCYLNGDGYDVVNEKHFTASTVSRQLCIDLRDIALKLGYTVSLSSGIRGDIILGRKVKTKKSWRMSFVLGSQFLKNDKDFIYLKVKKIEHIDYKGFVYDLVIDKDHTFCTPYGTVHNCNHDLNCHCNDPVCSNKFDEIWHVIFFSYTGKLRQDFQLHRRCAFIIIKKLGMIKELRILSDQISMESFLDIKLTEPSKTQTIQSTKVSVPHKKRCEKCDMWFDDDIYKNHMEQHYKESSTDGIIVKQFTGKHEKHIETHVCEKHSRRAVFTPDGAWTCPVFDCTEQIKLKMLPMQESEDYMICLFHQCKIKYDPNNGTAKCQITSCDNKQFIKRSYLMMMVKEGFVEFNGEKVPIDIDSRTVVLDGYKIVLKI